MEAVKNKKNKKHKKIIYMISLTLSVAFLCSFFYVKKAYGASDSGLISIGISAGNGSDMASVLQMLLVLTGDLSTDRHVVNIVDILQC